MAEPDGSGRTRRDRLVGRLERAERKADRKAAAEISTELALPPFPDALAYVWRTYLRLRRRTRTAFAGPAPIGWMEIDAFTRLSGVRLAPWEIGLIESLDDVFLAPEPRPSLPEGRAVKVAAAAADAEGVRSVLGSVGKGRRVVKRGKGGSND